MNQPPVGMVPSGKRLHNYGTSPPSVDKSTISMGHVFASELWVHRRVSPKFPWKSPWNPMKYPLAI
jgi:hypothetical protein